MGAILQSLGRTVAAGVVLVILLAVVVGNVPMGHAWGAFVMRWLHVVAGIMWIGTLPTTTASRITSTTPAATVRPRD